MSDGTKGPVPVSGIEYDVFDKPPSRIELRDMRANYKDQWNLYLQAMERFMDPTKEKEPLSFYQIAVLYKYVNNIAQSYGTEPAERRDAYIKAAKDFRMPYWDWALQTNEDVTLFPREVWSSTIPSVIRPGSQGKSTPMSANPLASYQFGSKGQTDQGGAINMFPKVDRTLRWPNTESDASDESTLQTWFNAWKTGNDMDKFDMSRGKNLTERVFWILTAYTNFGAMCCNLFQGSESGWSNWGSFEDVHNAVHNYVGNGGHMSSIQLSSFDPVFWLHHTNIDRLFAIWQALHDDSISNPTFVAPSGRSSGTRVIAKGLKQNAETPLAPFNASETIEDFWTSAAAKDTKTFGYVYPETRDWVYKDPADIKSQLISLYSYGSLSTMFDKPSINSNLVSRARLHSLAEQIPLPIPTLDSGRTEGDKIPEEIEQKAAHIKIPTDRDLKKLVIDNKYLEWLVNIKAEKHANNGDFVVHVFLGGPQDDNPALYVLDHNHVAAFSALGQDSETGCEKCKVDQAERLQVTGQIPLTLALVERYQAGLVDGLTPEVVEPYLAQNLHWRVVTGNAQLTPRDQINGLLVGVVTCEVTVPTDENALPQYAANVVPRPAATTKKQENWSGDQSEGRGDGTGYTGGEIPVLT
ncbi:MAG: hypothetical protein Q9165_001877 [Trypethelium subeluteriae]